jgi:hypothetical protein
MSRSTPARRFTRIVATLVVVLAAGMAAAGNHATDIEVCGWDFNGSGLCIPGFGKGTWTSIQDDRIKVRIRESGSTIKLDAEGEIDFNDEGTDIVGVERGGHFELEERKFGRRSHRIMIWRNDQGTLERRYYRGRKQQPLDDEGRAWFAATLPRVFRNTILAMPSRVRRLLTVGGAQAVLAEVEKVQSDYVARAYYSELLKQGSLSAEGVHQVIEHAGRHLDSDYELAELLLKPLDDGSPETLAIACAAATKSLDSDYERGRVLKSVVERDPLTRAAMQAVLAAAAGMGSDYEIAQLLVSVARRYPVDVESTPEFFAAVKTIGSSYEARRVLAQVVENGKRSPQTARAVLVSAAELQSDYERTELLRALARDEAWEMDGTATEAYVAAAADLGSDHERGRALTALLKRRGLDATAVCAVVAATASMSSDYDRAGILIDVAESHATNAEVRTALRRAAEDMSSDYERQRVLAALGRGER